MVLIEHMINDTVLTYHIKDLFVINLKKFNIFFNYFSQLLQSLKFGLERALFFQATNNKTHIFLLDGIAFLLFLNHKWVDLENFLVIFQLIFWQTKFRAIFLNEPVKTLVYVKGKPFAISVV